MQERARSEAWAAGDRQLSGLALSGGGIRSASFSLGIIQGLDALHALPRIDYMTSVSGGSYAAGWVQAHLGADQHGAYRDGLYYEIAGKDFHRLLWNTGDNVEQLRTSAQFINKGSFWGRAGPKSDHFNFEMSRDFTGSDGLGYVATAAFGRDVESVTTNGNGVPTEVVVEGSDLDLGDFRLSEAFEAYRLLGFQMAKTYLAPGADVTRCEFNSRAEP